MGDKVSSSKPKAKSTVNDQVKAGFAALKDFLGGHNEPNDEPQMVTSDEPPIAAEENSATEDVVNGTESNAEATSDPTAPALGAGEPTTTTPEPNQLNSSMESNGSAEQTENSSSEVNVDSAKPIDEPKELAERGDQEAGAATIQNSETKTNEQTPGGQQSIDEASFEDAVEVLRAAGPSGGRAAAARTIAELGSQRATPHLIAAMFDDDPDVRSAAEEALARIGEPTFKHMPTPQSENVTMMQPPSSAPQRSDSPAAPGGAAPAQPIQVKQTEAKQKDQPQQSESRKVDSPAKEAEPAHQTHKPHKLKAVPNKPEAAIDPEASEDEQQLLLEERAVRQRLGLIVQQLSEKIAARKESENEVQWRLERESKLLADAAMQRANEEKARKQAEEEAAQRRKQEMEAIAAEQAARAKADAEAERLANAEVRLRNEVAKLNQAADELEQRRRDAENARVTAAAAARLAEAQRLRDEAERNHKAEVDRLRNDQAMLTAATEKATARRAEVAASRERAEKDAAALAEAQSRMAAAEDARTKAETERVKLEAELKLKVETEESLLAAAKQRAVDEQARLEEEARRHREAEERRLEDLQETRRKAELEAKQRSEREQQIRHQLDTLRISDADVRKRIEEGEVRRRAADEAFRLVAEKVQRVEAEAHAAKLEEEQILAKLEAARRNAAVEAQARAEQEKRIKEEIEMFRRLEDEERPRLEELILQRSDAESRLQHLRERLRSEEEARSRADEQAETVSEYRRPLIQTYVTERLDHAADHTEVVRETAPAPVHFEEPVAASAAEARADEDMRADIPAAEEIPAAISSYLHSVDPYKRAAAVAELARSQSADAFALIARCFDDHSPHVRNAAARALRKLEPHKSVDLFNRAMEEGTPERRKNIGIAIGTSGLATEAIDNLAGENREETYNALSILFVMAKTGEVQPLVQAIEEHENEEVCRAVLKLLTLSGQSELGDAALQRRVMGVAASRQKTAERHDEIPDFRLRIAEVEVKRALKNSED
ncbi:MAG TPA: HEAT repeat domain-containing protein [Pyrinomonadaceae bacterium]|nr:HEAT repeat domain-containing protein [Pyrinomonadaceae bacterium]